MRKKYTLFSFIFLFWAGVGVAQQQFTYTQYIDNLVPINPAWSLTKHGASLNILGRKQWVNVDGAPTTFMANGFVTLEDVNASVGFTAMADKVGPENLQEFKLFFAKSVRVGDDLFLATSLSGGARNYNARYSDLMPDDPALMNANIRETNLVVGASIMIYTINKFYAGISLPRINLQGDKKSNVSDGNFLNFYFANFGYTYEQDESFRVEAATVLAYTANVPLQLDMSGKMWFMDTFGIGANYRTNNETALLTSFKSGSLNFGYSYSFVFGNRRVTGFQNATHEITLGIDFGNTGRGDGDWSRRRLGYLLN